MEGIPELWLSMELLYPMLFESKHGAIGGAGFRAWSSVLEDLSPQRINYGFEQVKKKAAKYPPDALEFKRLCEPKPEDFGIPDQYAAYIEACHKIGKKNYQWSHVCVQAAATNTGYFLLKCSPEAKSSKVFKGVYETILRRYFDGEEIIRPMPKWLEKMEPEAPQPTAKEVSDAMDGVFKHGTMRQGGQE